MVTEIDGNTGNFSLRDEIKAYWSARAAEFDDAPGHRISSLQERAAWHRLIEFHLGSGLGRRALDLATGTGEIAVLLDDLDYVVTGVDWSERMLDIARDKARKAGRDINFRMADAECTTEPDKSFNVLIARHLVWTLVDPRAAFAEWHRLLVPGGRLLIIDGDFVNASRSERILRWFARAVAGKNTERTAAPMSAEMTAMHDRILRSVYFSRGARSDLVADLLADAGFQNIAVDLRLSAIRRAQGRQLDRLTVLMRGLQHRYAISATRSAD